MQSNQISISTLKTAIQKALTKNLSLILADAVEYLENHDFQVKQRKKRSKSKPLQNIDDLQKKTQTVSAQKMKSIAYLNLNTNRVNSDSKKIKEKHPKLQFGNLKQDNKIVWVCGTPGHLQNTLNTLKQNDEKCEPIFEPISEKPAEESDLSEESEKPVLEEPVEEDSDRKSQTLDADEDLLTDINNILDLPENEVDPKTSTFVSAPIILKNSPKKPKKLKRRKKLRKPHDSLVLLSGITLEDFAELSPDGDDDSVTRVSEKNSDFYSDYEQRETIF